MTTETAPSFSSRERVLVAAAASGRAVDVRMESAMSLTTTTGSIRMTPFPKDVMDLLQQHNATRILVQVGTSASREFGSHPMDTVEPWHSSEDGNNKHRLDLGPSGVRVQVTLRVQDAATVTPSGLYSQFEAVLHDLVARRIILAPFFSISVPRLHRHWISWWDNNHHDDADDNNNQRLRHFEVILPTEGAALSSEGMREFALAFSPCHNQSGIFHWNEPKIMSELFVKRQSSSRHSIWIQLEQQQHQQSSTTRFVKGLQFQQSLAKEEESSKLPLTCTDSPKDTASNSVALADLFPQSTRHRSCPFVQQATLETIQSPQLSLLQQEEEEGSAASLSSATIIHSRALSPKQWKEPWMTILPTPEEPPQSTRYQVHQALRRPRGVSYSGKIVTEVVVTAPPDNCRQVSVDISWFLPPIVVPQWQSLRVVWEDAEQRVERLLDWRQDLQASITMIDRHGTNDLHHQNVFDDGTLFFRIPHWNVTTTTTSRPHSLSISLDYRPAFLSFEHFPGDANRGVEIPPAKATFTCQQQPPIHLYSNSLLLLPPVPDMSMPFNVLSMSCSLYAFVVGSILNLLIRKGSERVQRTYDPSKVPPPGKLRQLVGKIKEKVQGLKGKSKKSSAAAATGENAGETTKEEAVGVAEDPVDGDNAGDETH